MILIYRAIKSELSFYSLDLGLNQCLAWRGGFDFDSGSLDSRKHLLADRGYTCLLLSSGQIKH